MKLLIAIVQDEDAPRLISALMEHGYGVTKLATTGGFLRAGNTTVLTGVEGNQLDETLKVIESVCKPRKQIAPNPSLIGVDLGAYGSFPIEVTVGGATVFVLAVDQFIKL